MLRAEGYYPEAAIFAAYSAGRAGAKPPFLSKSGRGAESAQDETVVMWSCCSQRTKLPTESPTLAKSPSARFRTEKK